MTYLIDGQPLDNPTLGWVFRSASKPLPRFDLLRPDLTIGGRDGVAPGLPVTVDAPTVVLVVQTPRANLPALVALVTRGTYLTDSARPGRRIRYEVTALTPTGYGPEDQVVDASFTIRYPTVAWRDDTDATTTTALSSASVTVAGLFPGLSADIPDAILRIRGAVSGLQITDAGSGSWVTYSGAVTGAQWLRYESDTGRAYLTTTDTWTGGTEVSGEIDFGGGRGWFELSPQWSTPAARTAQLTVTTATRSAASIQVRGRGAHIV